MDLKGLKKKKILVAGLGKSGISALNLLSHLGYNVSGCDDNEKSITNPLVKKLIDKGIEIYTGKDSNEKIFDFNLVILSPGIDQRKDIYIKAAKKGIIVTGELEISWSFFNKPVVAITGTNGKSTVTELISDMLEKSGKRVFRGGNLGTPLSDAVLNQENYDIAVLEISSFQIDTIIDFKPEYALLLNITPDHLDRYEDFQDYMVSKLRIFKNQDKNDVAVINSHLNVCINHQPVKSFFNSPEKNNNHAFIHGNKLKIEFKKSKHTLDLEKFKLKGSHNLENLCAAAVTAMEAGADSNGIQEVINSFKGLHHRMEYCGSINDIEFINDSKATNPDSVLKAIAKLDLDTSLIMGGRDKGYDYSSLSGPVNKKIKNLILIGETKEKIAEEIDFKGNLFFEDSMENAVNSAFENLGKKGMVLLSPACSSFDMFKSYIHRGEEFVKAFKKLKTKELGLKNG